MEKRFLFISCEEAQHICDKSQYDEASLWEKLKLNLRLSWCRVTRAYYKRNTKLTKVINTSKVECMDKASKEALKENFEKALKEKAS